jgi:hypothetical protein
MTSTTIDVWNVASFDPALLTTLCNHSQLIRDYLTTSHRQFLEREADHRALPPSNPHDEQYLAFVEEIGREMETRTIRAWHYTRLVDDEARIIRENGIYAGTLDTLRHRLEALATAGLLTAADAEALYAASPYHDREQQPGRLWKFWLTSTPERTNDSGVRRLLENWGGESTYFWLEDDRLKKLVAKIGRPRILEVAVPIAKTRHAYSAGCAIVGAFARTLGCRPDREAIDVYITGSLDPTAILAIHSDGEPIFRKIGKGYPVGFVATS